ncbi:MAG TPA: cysteine desulfurase [Candidatus Rubneribacter avistercoris]|nr:cysteine desulfurase [Candidatus Rubneribacter avistercoris]
MTDETYLDNAATTRPDPRVIEVVAQAMADGFGNASARHARGRRARALLEESREAVADALGVDPSEVVFTSGGTESNNLAVAGACRACRAERDGIVVSALEHASVTKSVRGLKREGWPVSYVKAPRGELDLEGLRARLNARTALITCMLVQNEVGFVLPVDQVVAARNERAPRALVHTDAVQAFCKIPFYPREVGVDLASVSSHKIGGPQGVGALYVRAGTKMFTTAFGGGQERGLRSGTEALPLIAGFAEAVRIAMSDREVAFRRVCGLRRRLVDGVRAIVPDVRVNSRDDGSPYIVSLSFPRTDGAALMEFLDAQGVCVSKASACETLHPHVPPEDRRKKHPLSLRLAGVPTDLVESTVRVSFSRCSAPQDVDAFVAALAAYKEASQVPHRHGAAKVAHAVETADVFDVPPAENLIQRF